MPISFIPDNANKDKVAEAHAIYPNVYDKLSGEERRIVNITKAMRKDIKDAIKRGLIPEGKYAVRKRHTNAIDIEVTAISILVFNPEWLGERDSRIHDRYNEEASSTLAVLRVIIERYNYDRSDVMTDYFDVHYYANVQVDYDVESNELDLYDAGRYAEAKPTFTPRKQAAAEREAFNKANPPKVEAEGELASVVHNPRKNGVEVRFKGKPTGAALIYLKDSGFRYSQRQDLWYTRFTPAVLAEAKAKLGGSVDALTTPTVVQVGSGF